MQNAAVRQLCARTELTKRWRSSGCSNRDYAPGPSKAPKQFSCTVANAQAATTLIASKYASMPVCKYASMHLLADAMPPRCHHEADDGVHPHHQQDTFLMFKGNSTRRGAAQSANANANVNPVASQRFAIPLCHQPRSTDHGYSSRVYCQSMRALNPNHSC
jgi:hypothetical protein